MHAGREAKIIVQYRAAVLFSWFTRVTILLDCKTKGHDASMVMSVFALVPVDQCHSGLLDQRKKRLTFYPGRRGRRL